MMTPNTRAGIAHLAPTRGGRCNPGASCGLYGNGSAFRTDIFALRRWSSHRIKDAEFGIGLLLDGHKVTYVRNAILRAEMPTSLDGATSQNER